MIAIKQLYFTNGCSIGEIHGTNKYMRRDNEHEVLHFRKIFGFNITTEAIVGHSQMLGATWVVKNPKFA